eukprot:SAG11_NODE_2934_length_2828_cov_1.446684_2_plen_72_part_00
MRHFTHSWVISPQAGVETCATCLLGFVVLFAQIRRAYSLKMGMQRSRQKLFRFNLLGVPSPQGAKQLVCFE